MRARIKKAVFEAFQSVVIQSTGFSLVPSSRHPFGPYGIAALTECDGQRWLFVALVTSDMDDSFSMRLAWNDSPDYPDVLHDHGLPLADQLRSPRGTIQLILGESGSIQLDPIAAEHEAYMNRWKVEALADGLAGRPIQPPRVTLLVPSAVEVVIGGVLSSVADAWSLALDELRKLAGQICTLSSTAADRDTQQSRE